jgi:hypothetical protein
MLYLVQGTNGHLQDPKKPGPFSLGGGDQESGQDGGQDVGMKGAGGGGGRREEVEQGGCF